MADRCFPPELVDRFFVHAALDGGLTTLKTASLVCRVWRAISCPDLFRRAVVANQDALEGLELFLQSDLGVGRHVRTLAIHPRPRQILVPSPWVADVPARLAPLLGHLQTIELVGLHEHDTQLDAAFIAQFAEFASVDGLAVRGCSLAPPVLHALIAASVSSTVAMHAGPGSALPQLRRPALVSLEVRPTPSYLSGTDMILPWLAATPTAQSLRTLKLTMRLQNASEVGQFVQLVGARLEELELKLDSFLGLPRETESESPHWTLQEPARVRRTRRHKPVYCVTRDAANPTQLPDLSQLAEPLGQLLTRSLKDVLIAYRGPLAIETAREMIQEALAAVHARGHLVVHRAKGLDGKASDVRMQHMLFDLHRSHVVLRAT